MNRSGIFSHYRIYLPGVLVCFFNLFAYAQDWPALGRYRDDDEHLKKSRTEITAVFMGNSITDFWISESPVVP